MNKRDLLLEIGLEEMPARFVTDAMNQLGDKTKEWLSNQRIAFEEISLYSTPRRLAIMIQGVSETQEDISEEARGPAKRIALDDEGNWSKAALGFARGQGVDVNDIFFKEVKGTEYVFVNKFIKGQETIQLLPELKEIIKGLHFPKNMRWANYDMRYVRPIHWICALFGKDVIPMHITSVTSGNYTFGHRFLGEETTIDVPGNYKNLLLDQYVIVDPVERKEMIRSQLNDLESEKGWIIPVDEALLEEVNNLVEYPTAVTGKFDEKYLNIPAEVLITSMKEHQRYFPVKNENEELIPYFITFRNGNDQHLGNVAKGNEKVLKARLADAEFFYEEDKKLDLSVALKKLDKIVFHEELGSIGDKVRRVRELSGQISTLVSLSEDQKKKVDRTAEICKFDLVTQMVNEFTELQGFMGSKYAKIFGEDAEVASAINEHYKPRSADDSTPESDIGSIVSIADKLDTIVGFFSIGVIPTGSQDPYGLRRQAAGIVQTLIERSWNIKIETLIEITLEAFKNLQLVKRESQEILQDLKQFFQLRLKNILQERNVRYDVNDAVLNGPLGVPNELIQKSEFLMTKIEEPEFKEVVEALSRVTNIAKKAEHHEFDIDLFQDQEEKALYQSYQDIKEEYQTALKNGGIERAFTLLSSLRSTIDAYFDHIMVMTDDEKIKHNRLGFLATLSEFIHSFARFNQIILK